MLFPKIKKIHAKSHYKPMYYKVHKSDVAEQLADLKEKHKGKKKEYKPNPKAFSGRKKRNQVNIKYSRAIFGRLLVMALLLGIGYAILTTDKIKDIITLILG